MLLRRLLFWLWHLSHVEAVEVALAVLCRHTVDRHFQRVGVHVLNHELEAPALGGQEPCQLVVALEILILHHCLPLVRPVGVDEALFRDMRYNHRRQEGGK